jgi:hypothetical protein
MTLRPRTMWSRRASTVTLLATPAAMVTIATSAALGQATVAAPASGTIAVDLLAAAGNRYETPLIARCSGGEVLGFGSKSIESPSERSIVLKKRATVVRFPAMPSATDSVERWRVTELLTIALTTGDAGKVSSGSLTFVVSSLEQAQPCEVEALVTPRADAEPLDDRIMQRESSISGSTIGWAAYESPKRRLPKNTSGCTLVVMDAPGATPLSSEASAAFFEGLDPKKDRFRNGPLPGSAPPADTLGYELRLLMLGMVELAKPVFISFGPKYSARAAQVAFTVIDRSNGTIVTRGRASRPIGDNVVKDIGRLARMVTCR